MFGSGKDQFVKLVEKNRWDALNKKLSGANKQTRLEIAEACSHSSEDESMNIMIRLLTDSDPDVQLQAVKSLGISGRANAKSHLTWLSNHLPAQRGEEIQQAIKESFAAITARHA